jgi:hypothetical protein
VPFLARLHAEKEGIMTEAYDLSLMKKDPDHVFNLTTESGSTIPISIRAITELTPDVEGQRAPNLMEAVCLVDTILGNHLNPYAGECGLMPIFFGGFRYSVWVSAQVRLRKAVSQPDYNGYRWGWIDKEGARHESGRECTLKGPENIAGVWGEVYRKSQAHPYYHETFLDEFAKQTKKGKGVWEKMTRVMILKVNRDQTHRLAYADKMGVLYSQDELRAYDAQPLPEPKSDVPHRDERRMAAPKGPVDATRKPVPMGEIPLDLQSEGTAKPLDVKSEGTEPEQNGPVLFVCNECGRTYHYGKEEGKGVKCECMKGTLVEVGEQSVAMKQDQQDEKIEENTAAAEPEPPAPEPPAEEKKDEKSLYMEVNGMYVAQNGRDFVEFASYVLCVDEDEIAPSKLTDDQLNQIKSFIETEGVAIS